MAVPLWTPHPAVMPTPMHASAMRAAPAAGTSPTTTAMGPSRVMTSADVIASLGPAMTAVTRPTTMPKKVTMLMPGSNTTPVSSRGGTIAVASSSATRPPEPWCAAPGSPMDQVCPPGSGEERLPDRHGGACVEA